MTTINIHNHKPAQTIKQRMLEGVGIIQQIKQKSDNVLVSRDVAALLGLNIINAYYIEDKARVKPAKMYGRKLYTAHDVLRMLDARKRIHNRKPYDYGLKRNISNKQLKDMMDTFIKELLK